MKLKSLALGAVLAVGMTAAPAKASAQIDNDMITQIAIMLLAQKLGIDSGGILGALGGSTGNIFDMAPAFALGQYTNSYSPEQLWSLRQSGLPWDQVATRAGVPGERYTQLVNRGLIDRNVLWRNTYQTSFGLNQSQINRLREMGFNWNDIGRTAVIAREAGVSIFNVAARYQQWRNWNTVAQHYKVSNTAVARRVASWRSNKTMPTTWRAQRLSPTWRNEVIPSSNGKKLGHYKNKAKGKAKGHGKG